MALRRERFLERSYVFGNLVGMQTGRWKHLYFLEAHRGPMSLKSLDG